MPLRQEYSGGLNVVVYFALGFAELGAEEAFGFEDAFEGAELVADGDLV